MLNLATRSTAPEFMDDPEFQGDDLIQSFRFIRLVNALGGGQKAVNSGLLRLLRRRPRHESVSILDVGCGIGDLGVAMVRWGGRTGFDIRYCGLECSEHTLELACRHVRHMPEASHIKFRQGDLFGVDLPAADIIIASMVLHHFSDADVARALANLAGKARIGLVINDLERSAGAWLAAWALTRFLTRSTARADALRSVEKGFTPAELAALCCRAGLPPTLVRPALGFRLLGVVET